MSRKISNMIVGVVAILFMAIGLTGVAALSDPSSKPINQQTYFKVKHKVESYTKAKFDKAIANKQKVFVKVGADWCHYCVINRPIFLSDEVTSAFSEADILILEIDMTDNGNFEGLQFLREHGQMSIPYYILYTYDSNGNSIGYPLKGKLTETKLLDMIKKL